VTRFSLDIDIFRVSGDVGFIQCAAVNMASDMDSAEKEYFWRAQAACGASVPWVVHNVCIEYVAAYCRFETASQPTTTASLLLDAFRTMRRGDRVRRNGLSAWGRHCAVSIFRDGTA